MNVHVLDCSGHWQAGREDSVRLGPRGTDSSSSSTSALFTKTRSRSISPNANGIDTSDARHGSIFYLSLSFFSFISTLPSLAAYLFPRQYSCCPHLHPALLHLRPPGEALLLINTLFCYYYYYYHYFDR